MNNDVQIRLASVADAAQLLEIYKPYVEHTAISFEYEVPSVDEFATRIEHTLQRYPYIVAVSGDAIVGYAYASAFKERSAYDWAVETSIYVKEGCTGMGCGKSLYGALEELLKKQHIINLNACIAFTKTEDDYLTNNSQFFHEHMGYRLVGTFNQCGYKFGRWYDMIWMEKMIGAHEAQPEKVIPFSLLNITDYRR
jgi:phosphinothricin acetyltransferase